MRRRANEIAALQGHTNGVRSAAFSPDGQRIVTASDDNTARIWDVSRNATILRSLSIALTAALAHGIGWRTDRERTDLLMQDAEDDLYAEALKQLGRAEDDPEIAAVAAELRAPLHPNCYLSPTQFAEKFGLPPPAAASLSGDRSETAAAAGAAAARERGDAGKERAGAGEEETANVGSRVAGDRTGAAAAAVAAAAKSGEAGETGEPARSGRPTRSGTGGKAEEIAKPAPPHKRPASTLWLAVAAGLALVGIAAAVAVVAGRSLTGGLPW